MFRCLSALSLIVFFASSASAQSVRKHFLESNDSPQQEYVVSPMLIFSPFGPQEIGVRGSTELWNDGFIDALNDSISAEGSFFAGRWGDNSGLSMYMAANMRWDFHLTPIWTVFGSPGLALRRFGGDEDWMFTPSFIAGGFWNIQRDLAVRADIELEYLTPRIGLAFRY